MNCTHLTISKLTLRKKVQHHLRMYAIESQYNLSRMLEENESVLQHKKNQTNYGLTDPGSTSEVLGSTGTGFPQLGQNLELLSLGLGLSQ